MVLRALLCHHRCGSTWLSGFLEEVCEYTGHRFAQVFDADMVGGDVGAFVRREGVEVLAYMNADLEQVQGLGRLRGVHVVRDPRDVLVSSYYAHRYSHPTDYWKGLEAHRAQLESMSEHDGLLEELQCRRQQFQQMYDWNYEQEGVLEVRFEDVVEHPLDLLGEALQHLELLAKDLESERAQRSSLGARAWSALLGSRGGRPAARGTITRKSLEAMLSRHNFEALSGGRQRGQLDRMHHYRSGSPGEWRDLLNTEHTRALEALFPGLVERLTQERR